MDQKTKKPKNRKTKKLEQVTFQQPTYPRFSVFQFFRFSVCKGFTLVEMLVVATIFAVIALALASSFVSGMRLWGRAQHRDATQTNALFGLEVMARELRQSVELPKIGFEGHAHELSFPAVLGDATVKITYVYDAYEKRLRRRQVNVKEILEETLEPEAQEKILFTHIDDVVIEFASFKNDKKAAEETRDEWKDSWEQADGLPWAIRVTVTITHDTLTKTILLPIR